ncbi:hypothetical protein ACIQNI_16870 [Streptomyces sp. NPDC091266]|uniref:hypothetical protein n=1 Tax=Streptomyces sp. NPDC091266 TaxID=3365978 RepID=UPI0037FD8F7F
MTKLRSTFIWCGVLGVVFAVLLVATGATSIVPPLHRLVEHGGASQLLATAVLALNAWVLLMLASLAVRNSREAAALAVEKGTRPRHTVPHQARTEVHRTMEQTREFLTGVRTPLPDASLDPLGRARAGQPGRFRAGGPPDPAQAESLLAGRSTVRGARAETPYSVIRALVWALPALGFIGTAAEMSQSIRGLSGAMQGTSSYAQLSQVLVSDVIRPLAQAFGITLFALGSSVVCHLLVSFVHTREERLLLALDELVLDRLAENAPPASPLADRDLAAESEAANAMTGAMRAAAEGIQAMNTELARLTAEAAKARLELNTTKPDRAEDVVRRLDAITSQLASINQGLDREMVLMPMRPGGRVPGQGLPGGPGDGVL